jgi:hypothetical protein
VRYLGDGGQYGSIYISGVGVARGINDILRDVGSYLSIVPVIE